MKELQFRNERRTVPDHVEALLTGVETWRYTYRQAMDIANQNLLHEKIAIAQREMLRDHFKVSP